MNWDLNELDSTIFDTNLYEGFVESTGHWLTNLTEAQNRAIDALDEDLAVRVRDELRGREDVSDYFEGTGSATSLNASAFTGTLSTELSTRG